MILFLLFAVSPAREHESYFESSLDMIYSEDETFMETPGESYSEKIVVTASPPQTPSKSATPTRSPIATASASPLASPSRSPLATESQTPEATISASPSESRSSEDTVDQETLDQIEAERQKNVVFIVCGSVIFVAVIFILICIYYKNRLEEDQNPAYTKAILGDDAFEFSRIDTL